MKNRRKILALVLVGLLLQTGCGKVQCSMENCKNAAVEDEVYGELYCESTLRSERLSSFPSRRMTRFQQLMKLRRISAMMFTNRG